MNNCNLTGEDELRWTFIVQEVPGTVYGTRIAAGQCGAINIPPVTTLRDINFALFLGNGNGLITWQSNRNFTLLASGCATNFTNWMQRVQADIAAGTGSTLLGSLRFAFKSSTLVMINSTTAQFDIKFDRSQAEAVIPTLCAVGLRLAPGPSQPEITFRGGSTDADSYVYTRSTLGQFGPELAGDDIHAVFCCDPIPEEPVDPRRLNVDCLTVGAFDCNKTVAGVRRLWAIQADQVLSTTVNGLEQINVINLNEGTSFTDIKIIGPGTSFVQEWAAQFEGVRWAQTLQVYAYPNKAEHRHLVNRLITGRWVFAFQDENDRWWLYGRRYEVRATAVESKTDPYKQGTNGYNLTFQTSDYDQVWEIEPALIPVIPVDPVLDCEQYVGVPLNPLKLWLLKDCFLYDMRNNFLS